MWNQVERVAKNKNTGLNWPMQQAEDVSILPVYQSALESKVFQKLWLMFDLGMPI